MIHPTGETLECRKLATESGTSFEIWGDGTSRAHALVTRLIEEMEENWGLGDQIPAEIYLGRYPELLAHSEAAVWLVNEEVRLRRKHGLPVVEAEILERFPRWQTALQSLLRSRCVGTQKGSTLRFPALGEMLLDYRLVEELGRGFLGRVFLAEQVSLANRPVVLKVTPRDGREHLSLARLQHTNIVPLYSAADVPDSELRVICMPYLGGLTFDSILATLRPTPVAGRSGRQLLDILDRAEAAAPLRPSPRASVRPVWGRLDFARTICWMGACLADALQHAHERGLLHLDLKPSNLLIAADGQPMLLDFHLAQGPIAPYQEGLDRLGGTPGYMSPEQAEVMVAIRDGRTASAGIDGRSDVYSLGVVLFEALAGRVPLDFEASARRLPRRNRQVSVGLADLIARCLARDPRDRYPDAAAVAADLRRHLADLPLRGVANRSVAERWRKWRRRRPHAPAAVVALGLSAATLLGAGMTARMHYVTRLGDAEAALVRGKSEFDRGHNEAAVRTLRAGLRRIEPLVIGASSVRHALAEELGRARRASEAEELHRFVDQLRFRYGEGPLPTDVARELAQTGRRLWNRDTPLVNMKGERLGPDLEERLRSDLLDLALFTAEFCKRADLDGRGRAVAVDLLRDAETRFGPNVVIDQQRRQLGAADPASRPRQRAEGAAAPRTAWEHYATGRLLLRDGELASAADSFDNAVALEPRGFWPNFYQGVCAYRLGRFDEALAAFRACIVLAPESAECYHNRALAYAALGRADRALRDYDQALRINPRLAGACLDRGLLLFKRGRYREAAVDLQRAVDGGADPRAAGPYLRLALRAQRLGTENDK